MTAAAMKMGKTNGILLRNRQIHGKFMVIPSSENTSLVVMVYGHHGQLVIVCGRHGLWPLGLGRLSENPIVRQSILSVKTIGQCDSTLIVSEGR